MREQYDICVIGAGVVGSILSAQLAKRGFKVAVIERDLTEQDRIVGELMQPGGVQVVQDMGLGHLFEGIDGHEVTGYTIFYNGRQLDLDYPSKDTTVGVGLRNGRFIQNARAEMMKSGVTVIEANAEGLHKEGDQVVGVRYKHKGEKDSHIAFAKLTIGSEGAYAQAARDLNQGASKVRGHFVGLELENCILPVPGHGHLVIGEHQTLLLYPITSTTTRLLVDFPGDKAPRMGDTMKKTLLEQVAPNIPDSARPSFIAAVEKGDIKMMPNMLRQAAPVRVKGCVVIGDTLNMRHPLTGGGMTVGLTDTKLLVDLLAKHGLDAELATATEQFYQRRHEECATINILADALYSVMTHKDLQESIFNYLSSGGSQAMEPMSLLSAVSRDRNLLTHHFFAVAKRSSSENLRKGKLLKAYRIFADAVRIVRPLMLAEHPAPRMRFALKASKLVA